MRSLLHRLASTETALFALLIVGLLVTSAAVVNANLLQNTPTVATPRSDIEYGFANSDESRAGLPNIFVGRVVKFLNSRDIREPIPFVTNAPFFAVDVERTIKGNAVGRVEVGVVGVGFGPKGAGALDVGELYLFAALNPMSPGVYSVDDGFGNLPLASMREAEARADEFEGLVIEAERAESRQRGRNRGQGDSCEHSNQAPSVELVPNRGRAGTNIRVEATNLVRPEAGIWWGTPQENLLKVASVDGDCKLRSIVTVPVDAKPGTYSIVVLGANLEPVSESFNVVE